LLKTLNEIVAFCGGEREVSVSREISKIHEETVRATAAEQVALWSSRAAIKGEIVVVIAGAGKKS
jgi:16S rRNA (cytidine1402-2'-O)-methyltransferase